MSKTLLKDRLSMRPPSRYGLMVALLALFLTTGIQKAHAQAGFAALYFIAGNAQTELVCENETAHNIDPMLTVYDGTPGLPLYWNVLAGPFHGALSTTATVGTATTAPVTPTGWDYTPTTGYFGGDTLTVLIYDGFDTATTNIYFIINPLPGSGSITGPTSVCVGNSISMVGSPSGGVWGMSNTRATVSGSGSVTGVTAGGDTVFYSISNSCGTDTNRAPITVVGLPSTPTTSLSGSATFCAGGNVVITTPTQAGCTYQWYDGATLLTGATNAAYTATASGNYKVTVANSLGCSLTSSTTTVTANPLPTNTITAGGATTFCSGSSVVLNASTGTGYTYQWRDGGVAVTGATNASYTASTAGTYRVIITNTTTGCSDSTATATTVTVNALPSAVATASGPLSFCSGGSVVLTGTAGSGFTYQWYDGSTLIGGATNVSYTASATGNYKITVTGGGGCQATSSVFAVSLLTAPTVAVTPTGSVVICFGDTIILSATVASGYTYQWFSGATAMSGETNATYAATTPAAYKVRVTNASGCSVYSAVSTVSYSGSTVVITPSGPTTFCSGSVVLNAPTGAGYTWQWYTGTTPITGATNASYTASATGLYKVAVVSGSGCPAISAPVSVTNLSLPYLIATGDTTFCAGGSVLLTINTSGTALTVFQWKRNSINIAGATNGSYTATTSGAYTCFENVAGSCIATTSAKTVHVLPAPTPIITQSGFTLNVSGGTFATFTWKRNGTVIAGATTSHLTISSDGVYTVIVTDPYGCEGTSASYTVAHLAVDNVNANTAVTMYPNPASHMLHFECAVSVHAVISCMDGKTALTFTDVKDADISTLPAGIYMVSVFDADGNRLKVEKLIKE